jgi:hypothetical protein
VLLSKLNRTGNEGVLGRAVDEWNTLKDRGDREDSRGSDLFMAGLNGLEEVVGSVVDALEELGEALGVGSPLYDNLVEVVGSLEITIEMLEKKRFT